MNEITHRFLHSIRGSVTIEFSFILILLLFILLSSAEISRLFYISSSLDLAISEAAKSAKNKYSNNNVRYKSVLQQKLTTHHGVLGSFIAKNNEVKADVVFSENISDMINDKISTDHNLPLAKYSVSYLYRPVFFPLSPLWVNTLLLREVIFVQEN